MNTAISPLPSAGPHGAAVVPTDERIARAQDSLGALKNEIEKRLFG